MDLMFFLATINNAESMCSNLSSVLRLVGIVVWGIKVVVPIILIIVGMIDMAKAVTSKSEDEIKKAQQGLIKKAIAAVVVFLVVTIVAVLMNVVGSEDYKKCTSCITDPWNCDVTEVGVE